MRSALSSLPRALSSWAAAAVSISMPHNRPPCSASTRTGWPPPTSCAHGCLEHRITQQAHKDCPTPSTEDITPLWGVQPSAADTSIHAAGMSISATLPMAESSIQGSQALQVQMAN